jgi:transcriptional regulator GlxA family with amidase domain
VVDDIHQAWQEPLSAAAMASKHGKSPEHLCRRFRCELGVTMRQYLVLLRLDLARGLLWNSDVPLAEVAAMTGFCDQSHLSRSLTALYGDTPKRFRSAAPRITDPAKPPDTRLRGAAPSHSGRPG